MRWLNISIGRPKTSTPCKWKGIVAHPSTFKGGSLVISRIIYGEGYLYSYNEVINFNTNGVKVGQVMDDSN